MRTAPVTMRVLRSEVPYVGTVRSRREVAILARVTGTVAALPVAEGEPAARDATLAVIHAPDVEARLEHARAEQRRAESERDFACETSATDRRLAEAGVLPRAQRDASLRACRSAEHAAAAAGARVRELEATWAQRTEPAPFAGRVLEWRVEPGEFVAPGRPLIAFGSEELELSVLVTESDIGRGVVHGTPVRLTLRDERLLTSEVTSISSIARGSGRVLDVRVALPPDAMARNGTSVDVAFVVAERGKGATVPADAVVRDASGAAVFVIEGTTARRQPVEPGLEVDGWVAISPPLGAETRVAVSNLAALRDGQRVYPVAAEPR